MAIKTKSELLLFINQYIKQNNNSEITGDMLNILFNNMVDTLFKPDYIIGEMKVWPSDIIPSGWSLCDGLILDQSLNVELYNILGDNFTEIPNNITFNLPDLRGKTVIGSGMGEISNRILGETGGEESVILTENQIPSHNHDININSNLGNSSSPVDNILSDAAAFDNEFTNLPSNGIMNIDTISSTGNDESHNNMQPYLTLNYIIFTGL